MTKKELAKQAAAAVKKHGSLRKAAAATGVPVSTLRNRMKNGDAGADERKRVAQLEKLVDKQQDRIDKMLKTRFKLPASKKTKGKTGSYTRIIIPDTHGAKIDPLAAAAFFADLEFLAPSVKEVVMLGDHLDAGGFLAQHHTLGYVAETEDTFEDDVVATNLLLDRVQSTCPEAEIHYIEGNHERRIERWCVTQALANRRDSAYLHRLFGVEAQLNLEKRNIRHYKQGVFYDDCRIPATFRLGRCFFTHGSRVGQNPAKLMLSDFGGNVVFGHVHRIDMAASRSVKDGEVGAWSPGCLCKLQPMYAHTQVTKWAHGYGLQFVNGGGDFLHINVPIIEGKSYLVPLAQRIK